MTDRFKTVQRCSVGLGQDIEKVSLKFVPCSWSHFMIDYINHEIFNGIKQIRVPYHSSFHLLPQFLFLSFSPIPPKMLHFGPIGPCSLRPAIFSPSLTFYAFLRILPVCQCVKDCGVFLLHFGLPYFL